MEICIKSIFKSRTQASLLEMKNVKNKYFSYFIDNLMLHFLVIDILYVPNTLITFTNNVEISLQAFAFKYITYSYSE